MSLLGFVADYIVTGGSVVEFLNLTFGTPVGPVTSVIASCSLPLLYSLGVTPWCLIARFKGTFKGNLETYDIFYSISITIFATAIWRQHLVSKPCTGLDLNLLTVATAFFPVLLSGAKYPSSVHKAVLRNEARISPDEQWQITWREVRLAFQRIARGELCFY